MCGFGVSNIINLKHVNSFCQKRGPDRTDSVVLNNIEFLHNLLHITGDLTPQPIVDNDVVLVFNGEIYNYKDFDNYSSEGQCIINLYKNYGNSFCKLLDGEYALCLVDFSTNKIIISTDTFATKPLWYEFKNNKFCVASYNSQLHGLGFQNGKKLYANKTKIYDLKTNLLVDEYDNHLFDINQHKDSFEDWIRAFENSIKKRTQNTDKGMFLGLSSGFDSGAIACELKKQNVNATSYSITNGENLEILQSRFALLDNVIDFELSLEEFNKWKKELRVNCEDFSYDDGFRNYNIKGDQAVQGLAAICYRANKSGKRIYFSGQGADEIISDYGFNGKKIYKHSQFGGLFPKSLNGFFPWHSFYDGTQIQYLNKEEYIAGHFGIETRYPFLDKQLVQEFLWLKSDLKNSRYKSCIAEYLSINKFPFEAGEKRGFHVTKKGKTKKEVY